MPTPIKVLGTALLFLFGIAQAHAALVTVGTYDADTNTNSVDVSATSTTGNFLSLEDFTSNVASAFAANLGGVINFDADTGSDTLVTSTGGPDSSFNVAYGNGKTLIVTSDRGYQFLDELSGRTPISGDRAMAVGGGEGFPVTLTFNSPDPIVQLGFTMLSRLPGGTWDNPQINTTVTLDDNSTITLNGVPIGQTDGGDDTFFGYQAPEGRSIVSLFYTIQDNGDGITRTSAIDDLGFVVIPEPGTYALLMALATLTLVGYRRRFKKGRRKC